MVEGNKLVFKRQLLNQLSCLSPTQAGMLGHLVNYSMDGAKPRDADRQLLMEPSSK